MAALALCWAFKLRAIKEPIIKDDRIRLSNKQCLNFMVVVVYCWKGGYKND